MLLYALVNLGTAALVTSAVVGPRPRPAVVEVNTPITSRGDIHIVPVPDGLRGGFWKHCTLGGGTLRRERPEYMASCPLNTVLDITNCFVNLNGKMFWLPHGSAMDTCRNCTIDPGDTYMATCLCDSGTANGNQMIVNRVNLDKGIYVQNDRLTCFGIEGWLETDPDH